MHAVGFAKEGDVDVVVDDQKSVAVERPKPARKGQQLPAGEGFVTKLNHVRAAAKRHAGDLKDAVGRGVGGDDAKASGAQQREPSLVRR
jgi:hypothetical protein